MSNLMDELMAEITRVNNLEIEANESAENLIKQVMLSRTEKLKEINEFCNRMNDAVRKAVEPISRYGGYRKWTHVIVPGSYVDGNHRWNNELKFGGRDVHLGIFLIGSKDFQSTYGTIEDPDLTAKSVQEFIDGWSEDTERRIEFAVTEFVKQTLQWRIEQATQKLKNANEQHAKYYGTEE